jgi:hypothetical protein
MVTEKLINFNNILADILERLANSLRSGNSNVSEEELDLITKMINQSTNTERELGTEEAIKFLNVSRNYFYEHVKPYLTPIKRGGQKTIYYTKKSLIEFKQKNIM